MYRTSLAAAMAVAGLAFAAPPAVAQAPFNGPNCSGGVVSNAVIGIGAKEAAASSGLTIQEAHELIQAACADITTTVPRCEIGHGQAAQEAWRAVTWISTSSTSAPFSGASSASPRAAALSERLGACDGKADGAPTRPVQNVAVAAQLTGQVTFALTSARPFALRTTSMLPMHQSVCAVPLTVFVPKRANDAPIRNLPKRR
jgi:hypothetical protein